MRYRLTIVSVIAAALIVAAALFALSNRDEAPSERKQTELFPDGLGIVAAFTATAEAGGAALDPTALATPTRTSVPSVATAYAVTTDAPKLVLGLAANEAAPGDLVSVAVSGASPGETVEVFVGGGELVASSVANESGSAVIQIPVPSNAVSGPTNFTFSGTESGSSTITITIRASAPLVTIDPEELAHGDSITLNAEGFEPGESVTVEISEMPAGSAITGSDGSFSITTRLPELPNTGSETHNVSLRGDSGSVATSEITVVGSNVPVAVEPTSTTAVRSGDGNGSAGNSGSGEQPGGSSQGAGDPVTPGSGGPSEMSVESDAGITGISMSDLPAWFYAVVGAVIGWLGMLTLWVVRIDRRRDRHIAALLLQLTSLLTASENTRQTQDADSADSEIAA